MPLTILNPAVSPHQRVRLTELLANEDTFATTLLAICVDNYGMEVAEWDYKTIKHQLETDFSVQLPSINLEKIQALLTATTTNQFTTSWEIFSQVCRVLSGETADFENFSPVNPDEIAWGIAEVFTNDPPNKENGTADISEEVSQYVGVILAQNGVWKPPKILSFASMPSSNPAEDLQTAFTDDPSVFEAALKKQANTARDIEQYVTERYHAMLQELDSTPLKNRQNKAVDTLNKKSQ